MNVNNSKKIESATDVNPEKIMSRRLFLKSFIPMASGALLAACTVDLNNNEKPEKLRSAWGKQNTENGSDGKKDEEEATPQDVDAEEVSSVLIAVFGDHGTGGGASDSVAELVASKNPDHILAVGDHNYMDGANYDAAVGRIYSKFLYPYKGEYGNGAADKVNKYSGPAGNHDWDAGIENFLAYFPAFNDKRYFSVKIGAIEVFHVSSDTREPDGVEVGSVQANWLKASLEESSAHWKSVTMHHPAYTSGDHGSNEYMRWPFKEWGADIVFAGHDHNYERLEIDGFTYITSGLGGAGAYPMRAKLEGSQFFHSPAENGNLIKDYGAVFVSVSQKQLQGKFITAGGDVLDTFSLKK